MIRPDNSFGLEGYLAMMIGQAVPYKKKHRPTEQELRAWKKHLAENDAAARRGFTIAETLAASGAPTGAGILSCGRRIAADTETRRSIGSVAAFAALSR
jgi:hypothetical protein